MHLFLSTLLIGTQSFFCNQSFEKFIPEQKPATIQEIPTPKGYFRISGNKSSIAAYFRSLPLSADPTVYLYNDQKKANQAAQYAVLKMDIGTTDLQQCADAVMRLRGEYLFAQKRYNEIKFSLGNNFYCDYLHYANGYRVKFSSNKAAFWTKQAKEDFSYATFRAYMNFVFAYAGTATLYEQLKSVPVNKMQIGSVFIQRRNPYGHAVTVMDIAYNPVTKDTLFLLAQSYMPAQSIHILRNPHDTNLSPWYSTHFEGNLNTPEWTFTKNDLREW